MLLKRFLDNEDNVCVRVKISAVDVDLKQDHAGNTSEIVRYVVELPDGSTVKIEQGDLSVVNLVPLAELQVTSSIDAVVPLITRADSYLKR